MVLRLTALILSSWCSYWSYFPISDNNDFVGYEAAIGLRSMIHPPGTIVSDHSYPEYASRRLEAIIDTLGKIGPAAQVALPKMRKLLNDEDATVRTAAIRALTGQG